jgi:hypothetical protein
VTSRIFNIYIHKGTDLREIGVTLFSLSVSLGQGVTVAKMRYGVTKVDVY